MRASGKITLNFHSSPTRSLIMSGRRGKEAGWKAASMGAVVLCPKTTSNSCREQANLFDKTNPVVREHLYKRTVHTTYYGDFVCPPTHLRDIFIYRVKIKKRKEKCDFLTWLESTVTVLLLLPYAKAPSCPEAQNNNWTPRSLKDFAGTLTTIVANGSVSLSPFFFPSFLLNGRTCLLHILAQMALMSVWEGCSFSFSWLWCDVHVHVQILVVSVVTVSSLQLKVCFFSFPPSQFLCCQPFAEKGWCTHRIFSAIGCISCF